MKRPRAAGTLHDHAHEIDRGTGWRTWVDNASRRQNRHRPRAACAPRRRRRRARPTPGTSAPQPRDRSGGRRRSGSTGRACGSPPRSRGRSSGVPWRTLDLVGFGVERHRGPGEGERDLDEAVPESLHEHRRRAVLRVKRAVETGEAEVACFGVDPAQRLLGGPLEIDPADREPEELAVPRERLYQRSLHGPRVARRAQRGHPGPGRTENAAIGRTLATTVFALDALLKAVHGAARVKSPTLEEPARRRRFATVSEGGRH